VLHHARLLKIGNSVTEISGPSWLRVCSIRASDQAYLPHFAERYAG